MAIGPHLACQIISVARHYLRQSEKLYLVNYRKDLCYMKVGQPEQQHWLVTVNLTMGTAALDTTVVWESIN